MNEIIVWMSSALVFLAVSGLIGLVVLLLCVAAKEARAYFAPSYCRFCAATTLQLAISIRRLAAAEGGDAYEISRQIEREAVHMEGDR